MKKLFHSFMSIRGLLMGALLLSCLASCDMMHEDRDGCPDGLYVKFIYDYNLQRADMFKDHVGSVTVFIFDENGNFVKKQSVSNTAESAPLKEYGYAMHIEDLNPGKYQLIALANQKSYEETLKGKGAKYRWTDLQVGDPMTKLQVIMDREAANAQGTRYINSDAALDTLWHGIINQAFEVKSGEPTYQTVSLIRDNKNLNITLRQLQEPTQCPIEDYDIYITDRNGKLLYDNTVADDDELTYTPYAKWNSYFLTDGTTTTTIPSDYSKVQQQTAHADLSFNRLMYRTGKDVPAYLYVYNNKHNVTVAKINLASCLAEGRNAFDTKRYSEQEYLDRAYDFYLDFILVGDRWDYINLSIDILPWSIRIQNENI
jgi:hypothetical protein